MTALVGPSCAVTGAHLRGTSIRKIGDLAKVFSAETSNSESEVSRIWLDLDVEAVALRDRPLPDQAIHDLGL